MPKKIPELSNLQIGRIRANLSRKTTQIGNRLQLNAAGELKDKDGNLIEMTSSQLKSAELVLKHVLPGQQATTFNDVTEPEKSMADVEREYQEVIAQLPVHDLRQVLASMPIEERQALIDSMEETSQ